MPPAGKPSPVGKADRDRARQHVPVDRERARYTVHAAFAGTKVDAHHRGAPIRRPADERGGRSVHHERIDAGPRQRDRGHGAAVRVEPAQPPCAAAAPRADHASGRVEPERGGPELPQRLPELAVGPIHAPEPAVAPAVEVPPSIGIRDAPQGAAGRPRRLERRASRPSRDPPRRTGHAVPVEAGEIQGRGIPGHVRLIPGEPCEPAPVGTRGRGRVEVMARGEHSNGAAGDGDRDQVVGRRRTVTMRFAHREQAPPHRIEDQIAEPGRAFRRQRNGRGAGRLNVYPAVRVVREPGPIPGDGIRAAAVFMDARPHVERRGGDVGGPSRIMGRSCHIGPKAGSNEDVAPTFPRTPFEPADPARVQAHRREPDGVGDDGVRGDRGRPRPVREGPHAGRRAGTPAAVEPEPEPESSEPGEIGDGRTPGQSLWDMKGRFRAAKPAGAAVDEPLGRPPIMPTSAFLKRRNRPETGLVIAIQCLEISNAIALGRTPNGRIRHRVACTIVASPVPSIRRSACDVAGTLPERAHDTSRQGFMRHPSAGRRGADAGNEAGRAVDGRIPAAGAGRRSGQVIGGGCGVEFEYIRPSRDALPDRLPGDSRG